MDIRLLEYFIAVAELEHVGRAAERLHISQSPLSRQIRQLEDDLNVELFVRDRQRIRLTESGRWLLSQSQALLAHFERLRVQAEQRSKGESGTLSIAFTSAAMWSGILPGILRRFQSEYPDATAFGGFYSPNHFPLKSRNAFFQRAPTQVFCREWCEK